MRNRGARRLEVSATICRRAGCTHRIGLAGQTLLIPRRAAELGNPPTVIVANRLIETFDSGPDCRTHYFAVAIDETGESFWWDMDEFRAIAVPAGPELLAVPLCTASEYEAPLERPFDYPFHLSPLNSAEWEWQNLRQGRSYRGRPFRPGWTLWGNLHPSGGEAGRGG